jgi:hypothetical protein
LADELFDRVLVGGNILLVDVAVDEGLSLVHVDHHDLLSKLRWHRVGGHWRRLRDGWRVEFVDEYFEGYLRASRTKLRQDVCCNVVVASDVMELRTLELVLELVNFQSVGVHVLLVAIPSLVELVDDHC